MRRRPRIGNSFWSRDDGDESTENCPFGDGEQFLQKLQSEKAAVVAGINEWRKLAFEAVDKLKLAEVDMTLQAALQESALEEKDSETTVVTASKKQLAAKSATSSPFAAEQAKLTGNLSRVKSQSAAGYTVPYYLKSVAVAFNSQAKPTKVARWCKDYSATPSLTAFSAHCSERDEFRNVCKVLALANQRMS